MKKISISLLILCCYLSVISGNDSIPGSPFQLTFVYPLGTSGVYSANNSYNFSFNIITGITGGVDGIEIAGIINTNKYYNSGFQLAGIGNINGSYNSGGQIGGIFNITGGYTNGAQMAGICNIVGGSMTGAQIGGITNVSGDSVSGMQLAGIANIAGPCDGLQLAGITNISGNNKVQIGGIGNIAENIDGAQISGIFNRAGHVKGFQLAGIVNICDSIDGIPLALVSFVRFNGYRRVDIWANELFYANISYKIGIKQLYSILSIGYRPGEVHNNIGLGVGLGTTTHLGKKSGLDLEAQWYQINRNFWMDEENFLTTLRLNYVQYLGNRVALFAGPTLNLMNINYDSDAGELVPEWALEFERSDRLFYWVGINGGIRF